MKLNLDSHLIFILQVQEAEQSPVHQELLNWAAWGLQDDMAPRLAIPAIWDMPGAPDPDRDQDSPPPPAPVPINEKRAEELDRRINQPDFPAIWRKILVTHYLPPKRKNGSRCEHCWPVWQRPMAARVSQETYLEQLRNALEALCEN